MASLAEIYDWFMTGKKPTQAQFWASWGSFWNKNESIPQSAVSGLTNVLNAKVENDQFNAHKGANDAHAALFLAKEDKTQKGAPNGYAPLDEFTKLAAQYLNIVNDLVTGGATALLSAEQGKVLQTQVNAINTLLTSDNVNLDTVQELVDAIETVQLSLSSILVNDLTTGGTTKALTAEMGKTLKGLIDGLLAQVTPAPIYKIGQLCIFKNPDNGSNNDYLEPGDTVIGFVEGEFLNSGTYYGGDPMLLSSYEGYSLPVLPYLFLNEEELQNQPENNFGNSGNLFYHNVYIDSNNGLISSVYQLIDANYNYLGDVFMGEIPVNQWLPLKEMSTGELVLEYQIPDRSFFDMLFAPTSIFYFSQILIEFSPRDGFTNRIVTAIIFAGSLNQGESDILRASNIFQAMPDEESYKIIEFRNTYFGTPQTILKIRYK